jgi:FMN phosphatase YigB (HAD superfamily)
VSARVVSFDVFDTLIVRTTATPEDVFELLEHQLVSEYGPRFRGFARARQRAEQFKAGSVWGWDRSDEYSLTEVYDALLAEWPVFSGLGSTHSMVVRELQVERSVCRRHEVNGALYEFAKVLGKKVVIVSDTNLPRAHIETILLDAGYSGWEHLFVSNEVGTNKASGKIYPIVVEATGEAPASVVHFGDSDHSDLEQARLAGLRAFHLPPASRQFADEHGSYVQLVSDSGMPTLDASLFLGTCYREQLSVDPSWEHAHREAAAIGRQYLGPLVYGFTNWLCRLAEHRGVDRLFFVSREGWFLQKAYEELAPHFQCRVPSSFFYCSTRALRMLHLDEPVVESTIELMPSEGSLGGMLRWLGLSPDDTVLLSAGLPAARDAFVRRTDLRPLLEGCEEQLRDEAAYERTAFLAYLTECGLVASSHPGLVDSGLFGTSQRRLTKLLRQEGHEMPLTGMYLAMAPGGQSNFVSDSRGFGFLYNFYYPEAPDLHGLLELARILEAFLAAPVPSLRRMKQSENGCEPVFVAEVPSRIHPLQMTLQESALQFARELATSTRAEPPRVSAQLARRLMESLKEAPTADQARCIGSFPYDLSNRDAPITFLPQPDYGGNELAREPGAILKSYYSSNWRSGFIASRSAPWVRWYIELNDAERWDPKALPARVRRKLKALVRSRPVRERRQS